MRLPDDRFRLLARRAGLIALIAAALGGCARGGGAYELAAAAGAGPGGDYPVVVGEPYRIGDTLYTPADTLNYDEVGHLAADAGAGVTGAHRTLPLPSYAEVTSLESGRTILVRIERRGPTEGEALVALSPAALAQLGATAGTPVRVRRTNPPEDERAMLRAEQAVPPRMDTPESLLAALNRKLQDTAPAQPARSVAPARIASVELAPSAAARELPPVAQVTSQQRALPPPPLPPLPVSASAAPAPRDPRAVIVASLPAQQSPPPPRPPAWQPAPLPPAQVSPAAQGAFVVQVAALRSPDRARQVAAAIGGRVEQAGRFYRIRTGPFATRGQAEASLAKVRAAGYSEARIFTNG